MIRALTLAMILAGCSPASEIADRSIQLRAEAAAAEAQEPVAHNIATAVGRLFVSPGKDGEVFGEGWKRYKWIGPLRELPPGEYALHITPDPRIAEYRELLRDASQDLDDCTTDEGPVPFELKRARKTLERIRAALEKS